MMEFLVSLLQNDGPIVAMACLCFILMHKSQKKNINALSEQHNTAISEIRKSYEHSLNILKSTYNLS